MKRLTWFLLFVLSAIIVLLFLANSQDLFIIIHWSNWQIELHLFLIGILWLLSFFLIYVVLYVLGVPKRMSQRWKKRKINKHIDTTNQVIQHYLKAQFDEAIQAANNTEDKDLSTGLIKADCETRLGHYRQLSKTIQQLRNDYPEQTRLINHLQAKWLISLGEHLKAYETLTSEMRQGHRNYELWSMLLSVTIELRQHEEWQEWLSIAQKNLPRSQYKQLEINALTFQLESLDDVYKINDFWKQLNHLKKQTPSLVKAYLSQCDRHNINVNFYKHASSLLKQEWDEDWLWQLVNFRHLTQFHDLSSWIRLNQPSSTSSKSLLCFSVLSARTKLWSASEDYLSKTEASNTHHQTVILLRGWIESQLNNKPLPNQWLHLMQQSGMIWCLQEEPSIPTDSQ